MGKYELKVYDMQTENVKKTYTRSIIPVGLYIKFQKVVEEAEAQKIEYAGDLLKLLEAPMKETFPGLTTDEYYDEISAGDIVKTFREILSRGAVAEKK